MKTSCNFCGNKLTPSQINESIKPETLKFLVEGKRLELSVRTYNDAFYEVVSGQHKGNLVHRFDMVHQ